MRVPSKGKRHHYVMLIVSFSGSIVATRSRAWNIVDLEKWKLSRVIGGRTPFAVEDLGGIRYGKITHHTESIVKRMIVIVYLEKVEIHSVGRRCRLMVLINGIGCPWSSIVGERPCER